MQGNNLKDLIKIELVNRFEDVVLDEIRKNETARRSLKKEIDSMYGILEKIQVDLKNSNYEFNNSLDREINKIRDEVERCTNIVFTQGKVIHEKCKEIDKTTNFMGIKLDDTVSKFDFEIHSDLVKSQLKTEALHRHVENQAYDEKLSNLEARLIEFVLDEIKSIISKIDLLEETIADYREKILLYTNSNEATSKELNCVKKELFIHEKKIENIYTLIDRIKER